MSASRRQSSTLRILPMGLLLGLASLPLFFLFASVSTTWVDVEWLAIAGTLSFALGGGIVATVVGAAAGITAGTTEFPGRRALIGLSLVSISAPPAFWWIGTTRVPLAWGTITGPGSAAFVAGLVLSPITLLLVLAALREMPANLYEAARVSLTPAARLRWVLLPLLGSPLAGAFLLTVILLLGESELPFLFGFRTVMTDIITTFSQTFDVGRIVPLVVPLLLVVLALGLLAGRPLIRTVLTSSRGVHGVVRRPVSAAVGLCAAAPAVFVTVSIAGYVWAAAAATSGHWWNLPVNGSTAIVSIAEPVSCAWFILIVTLAAAYPARRLRAMRYFLWIGLLLFFIPAAVYAIGWIRFSQVLGSVTVPPIVAHVSRAVGLPALGFVVAYSRLPNSLEDAASLVPVSSVRRAFLFVLPILLPSLVASSALVAALTYADRDVASLLLSPGTSRLMLDLYLRSANAPSGTVAAVALAVLAGATLTVALAAGGPMLLWRRRA